jgi:ribosomal protein S18 acetylase RimI-like enzyme
MTQLQMKLPFLAGLLPVARPDLRVATERDAEALGRLLGAAFPEHEWSADRALRDLFGDASVAAVYVIDGPDSLLATASARYHAPFPGVGYVHWVGVDPVARGQALGTLVMNAVMARFVADGFTTAVLETDDLRLPAITSYLAQGYVPQYPDAEHEMRWSAVFAALAAWRRAKQGG